jgi:hypothetical protein
MFNRSLNHQSFFSMDTGRFPHLQEVALSGSLKRRTQCLEPRIDQHLQQQRTQGAGSQSENPKPHFRVVLSEGLGTGVLGRDLLRASQGQSCTTFTWVPGGMEIVRSAALSGPLGLPFSVFSEREPPSAYAPRSGPGGPAWQRSNSAACACDSWVITAAELNLKVPAKNCV